MIVSFSSSTITGDIEDIGFLPGLIKFASDAGAPKLLTVPGVEKSSISLLYMIPVASPAYFAPKLKAYKCSKNLTSA